MTLSSGNRYVKLWQGLPTQSLVDLGAGFDWVVYSQEYQTFAVVHVDGRVRLYDIAWIKYVQRYGLEDPTSLCYPFIDSIIDTSELKKYLKGTDPKACPEDMLDLARRRAAAANLDVNTAIRNFEEALESNRHLDLDPEIDLDPEDEANRIAGQAQLDLARTFRFAREYEPRWKPSPRCTSMTRSSRSKSMCMILSMI